MTPLKTTSCGQTVALPFATADYQRGRVGSVICREKNGLKSGVTKEHHLGGALTIP